MTSLSLQQLLPHPLRERSAVRKSQVWLQKNDLPGKGEKVFVRAPSGTGKTTLIHILYGLRRDFEGRVLWNGQDLAAINAASVSTIRQRQISIIFQDMRLFPTLSAWENLEIKRVLTNAVSEGEAKGMMDRLGIADRADRPAHTLSYGEQQRLAIIRALLQPFEWLLMDEPLSHLDEANTIKATTLIAEVVERNKASFLLADLDDNNHFAYTQRLQL